MKIHPVGAQLFHAVRRTDGRTDNYDEASRNFADVSKKCKNSHSVRHEGI